jgi:mono/diheme cytochrome c family protein
MKRIWLAFPIILVGCNGGKNQPNIELIQNMMDQPAIKSQGWDHNDDKVQMRMPPEGTVPRGYVPYKYETDPEAAGKNLANPYKGDFSAEMTARGKKYFERFCMVCHGPGGKGDGTVAPKMPVKPPPLISDKIKNYPDGRIFHIITMGQGVMGPYRTQLTDPNDRWAVVNYVRTLQGTGKGKEK